MKRLITPEIVAAQAAAGATRIAAPPAETIVTPEAQSKARELGIRFDPSASASPALADPGHAERVVDPSGVVLVRGKTVQLGRFTGAGPDKNIGLTDLITGRDRSPMTAGIMSWSKKDSFAWSLDYDEVDLVLDGVLRIELDGRALEGRAGDVFYIPKGSQIVFGTPSHARVFYVTYPANWAG